MSEKRRFRCLNCGERFQTDVLTPDEAEEARRQRRPTSAIHCPACHRTDIRDGWE
ncbi:zinc ribbon domain-containing protein [Halomonas sp. ND22Bw]|nr:zinc ribbon domain-containing protein [Halomonas sp. ND22Bw]